VKVKRGSVFWRFTNFDRKNYATIRHLYFVLTNPDINSIVLMVNISTPKGLPYEEFFLENSDHGEISRRSFIYFQGLDPVTASVLEAQSNLKCADNNPYVIPKKDATDALIKKMLGYAIASNHIATKFIPTLEAELKLI